MEIGAQFFTLREMTQTLDGLALALKQVADIGYRTVQISGTCPFEPEWMRDQLAMNGLRCVITHTPVDRLTGDPTQVAADHDVFGCPHVGLGWYAFDESKPDANYGHFLSTWLPVARALKQGGKLLMYHNHDQEFNRLDGRVILDRLMEDVPAELMGFTLDTFWVQAGGGDPAQWLEKLSGRIPCIHLKDYAYGRRMAVVGEGNINFDRVFEKAQAGGTQYMLVEQDDCNGEDPMDCLRRSYLYLKAQGFE
ncbi:MAG: sugar phosphate isomerase/epimerase [Clostridiales bacterium]|nr:sugar phosphate isomerase/epimerase [Clostridiales bacterium]